MNATEIPIDVTHILLGALHHAVLMAWSIFAALPWWALLLLGLLLVFRLVRPSLELAPASNPRRRRSRRRRW